jgi:DNA-binding transcriptional ArsR family regulator
MSESRLQIDVFVADKLREASAWMSVRDLARKVFLAEESIERALGRLVERGHIERNEERPRRYRWLTSETKIPLGFSRRSSTGSSWREEIETTSTFADGSKVVLYVYDDRITDGGQAALRAGDEAVMDAFRKLRRDDISFDAGELYGAVTDSVLRELGEVCAGIVSTSETALA